MAAATSAGEPMRFMGMEDRMRFSASLPTGWLCAEQSCGVDSGPGADCVDGDAVLGQLQRPRYVQHPDQRALAAE